MTAVTNGPTGDERDPTSGRFVAGNKCARGNPHARRAQQLRGRILDAVENELGAILTAVVKNAAAGDIGSVRWLLDRAAGTARQEPATPATIDVGALDSLAAVAAVSASIVQQIGSGEIDDGQGATLLGILAQHRATLEACAVEDLEARLARLERGAS